MGFFFFLLVTATLLIRPSEQIHELGNVHIYETLILLCFVFSFGNILEQLTGRGLETRPITVCVLGLLVAVVLSHLANGDAAAAWESGFEFFKVAVYYLLLVGNVTTPGRLKVFLVCLGVSAALFVLLAVLQYHSVIVLPEPPPPPAKPGEEAKSLVTGKASSVQDTEYDAVTGTVIVYDRLRGTGIFRDPNDLSLLMVLGFFIALYGLTDGAQGALRLAWLAPLVFLLYALSLTQSRGGLLSLLAGCLALFYARFGWRGTLALGLPLVPVALAVFGGRMGNISTSDGTGQSRIQIWSDSLTEFRGAPLFGIGMAKHAAATGKAAHNSFLHAYAELGLFGGTLFFGAFFLALLGLRRWRRDPLAVADPEMRRLLPFLMALVAAYFVGMLSLSRHDSVPTYLVLGLVTAFGSVATASVSTSALRFDGRLVQRLALASVGFLAASYMFVRVFRV